MSVILATNVTSQPNALMLLQSQYILAAWHAQAIFVVSRSFSDEKFQVLEIKLKGFTGVCYHISDKENSSDELKPCAAPLIKKPVHYHHLNCHNLFRTSSSQYNSPDEGVQHVEVDLRSKKDVLLLSEFLMSI